MLFLKDGTERVVHFASRPADVDAITTTEWAGATDYSDSLVKPLNINFADSSRFAFATINVKGNGERNGRTNAAGTLRIVRKYVEGTKQPDPSADAAFAAFGTKGVEVKLGVYRGPKEYNDGALVAGDEYDYFEFETDTARVVDEDENYICYDVPLVFIGTYAAQKQLVGTGGSSSAGASSSAA